MTLFDWREAAHHLFDYVISQTESLAKEIGHSKVEDGVIDGRNSGAILIDAAREDLENARGMFILIENLKDHRDQDRAYKAFFYALRGTFHTAEQIVPMRTFYMMDDANADAMRRKRSAKVRERNDAILSIRNRMLSRKRWQEADGIKRLLPLINEELGKQRIAPISERTLRRASAGRSSRMAKKERPILNTDN